MVHCLVSVLLFSKDTYLFLVQDYKTVCCMVFAWLCHIVQECNINISSNVFLLLHSSVFKNWKFWESYLKTIWYDMQEVFGLQPFACLLYFTKHIFCRKFQIRFFIRSLVCDRYFSYVIFKFWGTVTMMWN